MTTVEILEKAKALVEKGWTQREYSRGASGRRVSPTSPEAVCWCAYGAISAAQGIGDPDEHYQMTEADKLFAKAGGGATEWNDASGRTQAEVVTAFTKAIELAKAQP